MFNNMSLDFAKFDNTECVIPKNEKISENESILNNLDALTSKTNDIVNSVAEAINSLTDAEGERIDVVCDALNNSETMEIASIFWDVLDNKINGNFSNVDQIASENSDDLAQIFWKAVNDEYTELNNVA